MSFYVYILASKRNGTLYIGMTDDLVRRVWLHREKSIPGFTRQYDVTKLVWYEQHESRESSFRRERQMKNWYRAWKIREIEAVNSGWRDFFDDIAI
jgi:putative endonuclease